MCVLLASSGLSGLDPPDDGSSTHLWNVGKLQRDYTALQPRRLNFILAAVRTWNLTSSMMITVSGPVVSYAAKCSVTHLLKLQEWIILNCLLISCSLSTVASTVMHIDLNTCATFLNTEVMKIEKVLDTCWEVYISHAVKVLWVCRRTLGYLRSSWRVIMVRESKERLHWNCIFNAVYVKPRVMVWRNPNNQHHGLEETRGWNAVTYYWWKQLLDKLRFFILDLEFFRRNDSIHWYART
jgi:hypothetical protein